MAVKVSNVKKYLQFTGNTEARVTKERILLPDEKSEMIYIGVSPQVDYLLKKKHIKGEWFYHPLKKKGKLFAVVDKKDGRVKTLIISDLNIRIDKRGLIG